MSNKGYQYTDSYGETYEVFPVFDIYQEYNHLYLGLEYFDKELGRREYFCDVTVNLNGVSYLSSAIDTNNNGNKILDWLLVNGFGKFNGAVIPNEFCLYPVFEFNEDKLKEIDLEVFTEYARLHGRMVELHEKAPSLDEYIDKASNSGGSSEVADCRTSGRQKEQDDLGL